MKNASIEFLPTTIAVNHSLIARPELAARVIAKRLNVGRAEIVSVHVFPRGVVVINLQGRKLKALIP